MDREDVLRKIKACFDRAKSTDSENEAAICLRQAQGMMRKHGISEEDLGAVGYGHETVDTSIQVGRGRKGKGGTRKSPTVPVTLAVIINLMADAFGVRPVVKAALRKTDLCWSITYYGPRDRALLASYAHVVVSRAVEAGWQDYLTINPHYRQKTGGRAGYYIGWINTVQKQIEEFAMTPEEVAGTELVIQRQTGGALTKQGVSNQGIYNGPKNAGAEDGESFKLHRPVNVDKLRLEDKS